jgi:SpoVK/Ycf46/Vps4 family AAA+-type ATPase
MIIINSYDLKIKYLLYDIYLMNKRKLKNEFNNHNIENKKANNDMIYIKHEINSIDDLIYLGKQYIPGNIYNINLEKLFKLVSVLTKLQNVIGMDKIKKNITNQIIFFIQDFQDKNSDMLHTIIQGPPGVGKTMLGEIIGEIYFTLDIIENTNKTTLLSTNEIGCCENDEPVQPKVDNKIKFTVAKRSDLIGKYLGQTAAKTQNVIDKSLGGVLFIDEAYSLGNAEGRDSYSKECIDTINQNLSEKKNQLLVIIAGYKESLDTCFFNYNEGLRRRFPFVYTIDKYTPKEMSCILQKMITDLGNNWSIVIEQSVLDNFFEKNLGLFPNSAGDIETLIFSIKMEHAKRVFYCEPGSDQRKKILDIDLDNALKTYIENKEEKEEIKKPVSHLMMYI